MSQINQNCIAPLPWGDQGDGTYRNPILAGDWSDPDVIRIGEEFWMVASDFHWMGMQVLHSTDLVNWSYAAQLEPRLGFHRRYDEMTGYGLGTWAPAIRYHDGVFFVFVCTPTEGLFVTRARDPRGPWEPWQCVREVEGWEDPCPFWDDDGSAWLGRSKVGAGPIVLHRMSPDGSRLLDDGIEVYRGPVAEGTKIYKRDGWYYLSIPEGGVGEGWQQLLRARSLCGPYEGRTVLAQRDTAINGPHQGALVDTAEGHWWFFHFQDAGAQGRIVHLQPVRWEKGWPMIGERHDVDGVGAPVPGGPKPMVKQSNERHLPTTDDDFSKPALGLQWQWNHNPPAGAWSLVARPGWLRLRAISGQNPHTSRSTIGQKMLGRSGHAWVTVDASGLEDGGWAGLLHAGRQWHGIGVERSGACLRITLVQGAFRSPGPELCDTSAVELHTMIDLDGETWLAWALPGQPPQRLGEPLTLEAGHWKGSRLALSCFGAGSADLSRFHYQING